MQHRWEGIGAGASRGFLEGIGYEIRLSDEGESPLALLL